MIYIIIFGSYFKLGACADPGERMTRGFWHNTHPPELCGKLGDFTLLQLYEGCLSLERALHEILVPDVGEFYKTERLDTVLHFLELVLAQSTRASHVSHVRKPTDSSRERDRKPCCGGQHGGFERDDHMRRSFVTKGRKAPCERCGKMLSVRRDKVKQHLSSCTSR